MLNSAKVFAQTNTPKREMRAGWLSTVRNIDWPSSPSNSTEKKISDLINIIEYLKDANLNTVIMQVRPASDAMYQSNIEPWSSWLTGQQGKAPSPFFDPLQIAIEESHKRGMELHAWLNPYRIRLESYHLALDEMNVARQHPEWVLDINGDEILDPGIPEVREHIVSVITDIITRYDVDAIHFDDYFYLEGITNQDDATFAKYPNGFTNKGNWRRDNVTELLRMIYSTIQTVKPRVKFGQSPPGIWKSGTPEGTWGWNVYSAIYCDAVTWLDEKIIDYLAPQLYWSFGGGQDYGKLAPWWASVSNGRHVYPGLPFYRINQTAAPITDVSQIGKMVQLNRSNNDIQGEVYFTAHNFEDNNGGITDTLTNNYYKYPALPPIMNWKDSTPPNNPTDLRFDRVSGIGTTALTWDIPSGEDIKFYVLYRSTSSTIDINDAKNIFKITSKHYVQIDNNFPTENAYYYVTALDWNNNESGISNKFEYQPAIVLPDTPNLVFPANAEANATDTINFVWNYANNANSYSFYVSTLAKDGVTDSVVIEESSIIDTTYQVTGLVGETTYKWSVKAVNLAGKSSYAADFSFTTGFPSTPTLLTPLFQELNVALDPTFTWRSNANASKYHFQLAEGLGVNADAMVIDTMLTNTSVKAFSLKPGTFYAWQVSASNKFGKSHWAKVFQLKTKVILPETPTLLLPSNNLSSLKDSILFVWKSDKYAYNYRIQIATDESFSNKIFDISDVKDTSIILGGFKGATKYYWHVVAKNNGGSSPFSEKFIFSTGFPLEPTLLLPKFQQLNVELDPILTWSKADLATEYKVQLSKGLSLDENKLLIDSVVVDTVLYFDKLDVKTFYTWRVMARNNIGSSIWTNVFQFKTSADSILATKENKSNLPEEYFLEQNYPNPFNPTTTITFGLPEAGNTTLKIYNIIGQEIAILISDYLEAGNYNVVFDANSFNSQLTSGLYLYRIESKEFSSIKKMLLIK